MTHCLSEGRPPAAPPGLRPLPRRDSTRRSGGAGTAGARGRLTGLLCQRPRGGAEPGRLPRWVPGRDSSPLAQGAPAWPSLREAVPSAMCAGNQDDVLHNKKMCAPLFIHFQLNALFFCFASRNLGEKTGMCDPRGMVCAGRSGTPPKVPRGACDQPPAKGHGCRAARPQPCGRHGAAGRGVCPALAARPSAACARAQGVCPWGSGVQPCEGAGPLGRGSARGVFCASATRWGRRAKHREKVEPAGPRPPLPPHAPPLAPAGDLRAAGLCGKRCPSPVGQDRLNPLNPEPCKGPCRLPAAALRSLGEKTG